MGRVIKAPNIRDERPYPVVEREKVIRHIEDEIAEMRQGAYDECERVQQDAQQDAQAILAQAQQQKKEIIDQAKLEGEMLKETARQEGFAQGQEQGLEDARKQVAVVLQELRDLMAEGQRLLEDMYIGQEPEIRQLVGEIVGRVIQEKIQTDDEIVVRVAKECLRKAADRKTLRILIHPDDQKKIESWSPEFTRLFDDISQIVVETDPRVSRGGVMIETNAGGIDGRLDKQLNILNDTLLNL